MSNELLSKFVVLVADEVSKQIKVPKEVTPAELQDTLGILLQHADWFRVMLAKVATEATEAAVLPVLESNVRDSAEHAAEHWMNNSFDISDYDRDIKTMVEQVLDNYDFRSAVESEVEDAVTNMLSEMENRVQGVENVIDALKGALK